jgi:hypothetical protein
MVCAEMRKRASRRESKDERDNKTGEEMKSGRWFSQMKGAERASEVTHISKTNSDFRTRAAWMSAMNQCLNASATFFPGH